MRHRFLSRKWPSAIIGIIMAGYAGMIGAHTAGETLDPDHNIRNFTGQAAVTCFNDGNGEPDYLIARIIDHSPPVPGLLVNLQIYKGNKANSITDTVSGDAEWSPSIALQAGPGVYGVIVNKTDVGARFFEIEWHCNTREGIHTGTAIGVTQFGLPEFISD